MSWGRRAGALLLLAIGLGYGCDATIAVPECDRLQNFSCGCFPACQTEYVDVVDSRDAARCTQALRDAFAYWKICKGQCGPNCEYGWGSCAFSAYQEISLAPEQQCGTSPSDAGGN